MSDIAIHVEGLSKQYRIGKLEQYRTFRDTLSDALTAPFRRTYQLLRGNASAAANLSEAIWALKDISFDIKKGEVVGIIGRNGAGKSTLLKILSRIAEPTEGLAEIYGRVGALLEVGTGFHPELTGRENIYLNAAILGMTRAEIDRKFDEIVAFAEVEKFIDTPVKHYSSGMGLRLGFAVAAHLEPEILVVDEVLAVGDVAFQKKCLGKMGDVAQQGRTVLFVSHNTGAINQLCQSCVLLKDGRVNMIGKTEEVIKEYLDQASEGTSNIRIFPEDETLPLQILSLEVVDETLTPRASFSVATTVYIRVKYVVHEPSLSGTNLAFALSRGGADILTSFDTDTNPAYLDTREVGYHDYLIALPTHILKPGMYTVDVSAGSLYLHRIFQRQHNAIEFQLDDVVENTAFLGYSERRRGLLRMPVVWSEQQST
jgi:lipopolysaccharide transport system ATP-binding protein